MPLTLELLAEASHPVSEGTTGNITGLLMQLSQMAMVAIVPVIRPDLINLIMVRVCGCGSVGGAVL